MGWRGKGKLEEGESGPSDAFDQTFFRRGWTGGGVRLAPQLGRPVGGAHARVHPCVNGSPLFWRWQLAPAPQVTTLLRQLHPSGRITGAQAPAGIPSRHRSFPARISRRDYIIACTQHRDAILKTANSSQNSWATTPRPCRHLDLCWTLIPLPTRLASMDPTSSRPRWNQYDVQNFHFPSAASRPVSERGGSPKAPALRRLACLPGRR